MSSAQVVLFFTELPTVVRSNRRDRGMPLALLPPRDQDHLLVRPKLVSSHHPPAFVLSKLGPTVGILLT